MLLAPEPRGGVSPGRKLNADRPGGSSIRRLEFVWNSSQGIIPYRGSSPIMVNRDSDSRKIESCEEVVESIPSCEEVAPRWAAGTWCWGMLLPAAWMWRRAQRGHGVILTVGSYESMLSH